VNFTNLIQTLPTNPLGKTMLRRLFSICKFDDVEMGVSLIGLGTVPAILKAAKSKPLPDENIG